MDLPQLPDSSARRDRTREDDEFDKVFAEGYKFMRGIDYSHPIALLIGNTGVGKSTLCNALIGRELKPMPKGPHDLGGKARLEQVGNPNKPPRIANKLAVAKTILPSLHEGACSQVVWADTVGFEDTHNKHYEALASGFTQYLMMKSLHLKGFVVVIGEQSFSATNRASTLRSIMATLNRLGKDLNALNLAFVVSKTTESVEDMKGVINYIIEEIETEVPDHDENKAIMLTVLRRMQRTPLFTFDRTAPEGLADLVASWPDQDKSNLNEVANQTVKKYMSDKQIHDMGTTMDSVRFVETLKVRFDENERKLAALASALADSRKNLAALERADVSDTSRAREILQQALDEMATVKLRLEDAVKAKSDVISQLTEERARFESEREVLAWGDSVSVNTGLFGSGRETHVFAYNGERILRYALDWNQKYVEVEREDVDKEQGSLTIVLKRKKRYTMPKELSGSVSVYSRYCDTTDAKEKHRDLSNQVEDRKEELNNLELELSGVKNYITELQAIQLRRARDGERAKGPRDGERAKAARKKQVNGLREDIRMMEDEADALLEQNQRIPGLASSVTSNLVLDEKTKFLLEMMEVMKLESVVLKDILSRVEDAKRTVRSLAA